MAYERKPKAKTVAKRAPRASRSNYTSTRMSTKPTAYGKGAYGALGVTSFSDKERVGLVLPTNGSFEVSKFIINAGELGSFPWLAKHGALFEKYRFTKLIYRFRTQQPTTAAGSLQLAFDSDPSDAAPLNGTAMSNLTRYMDKPVWSQDCVLNVPCKSDWKYVKTNDDASRSTSEKRDEDHGLLFVSTEGVAVGTPALPIGALEVEYTCEFKSKAIEQLSEGPVTVTGPVFYEIFNDAASTSFTCTITENDAGITQGINNTTINMAPGKYMIYTQWIAAGLESNLAVSVNLSDGRDASIVDLGVWTTATVPDDGTQGTFSATGHNASTGGLQLISTGRMKVIFLKL